MAVVTALLAAQTSSSSNGLSFGQTLTIALVTAVLGGGVVAVTTSYWLTRRLNREGRWWEARGRVYTQFLAACDRAQ
jgi:hypothetical protein